MSRALAPRPDSLLADCSDMAVEYGVGDHHLTPLGGTPQRVGVRRAKQCALGKTARGPFGGVR